MVCVKEFLVGEGGWEFGFASLATKCLYYSCRKMFLAKGAITCS